MSLSGLQYSLGMSVPPYFWRLCQHPPIDRKRAHESPFSSSRVWKGMEGVLFGGSWHQHSSWTGGGGGGCGTSGGIITSLPLVYHSCHLNTVLFPNSPAGTALYGKNFISILDKLFTETTCTSYPFVLTDVFFFFCFLEKSIPEM